MIQPTTDMWDFFSPKGVIPARESLGFAVKTQGWQAGPGSSEHHQPAEDERTVRTWPSPLPTVPCETFLW